jgi:AcrR family transcriptional regulator
MPSRSGAPNRGPAAAAANRAALLRAARRLFATQGYHVPLSAIAREAGVGQGSLYRHFPTRSDLAEAIFRENMAELEATGAPAGDAAGGGAVPEPAFLELWGRVVELVVEASGFVTVLSGPAVEAEVRELREHLAGLLAEPLERAREHGLVAADLGLHDVLLVLGMLYGATSGEHDLGARRRSAHRVLELVGRGLDTSVRDDRPSAAAHTTGDIHDSGSDSRGGRSGRPRREGSP